MRAASNGDRGTDPVMPEGTRSITGIAGTGTTGGSTMPTPPRIGTCGTAEMIRVNFILNLEFMTILLIAYQGSMESSCCYCC